MRHRPSRSWSTPEELLEEWAQVSALARRPAPARARAPRRIIAGAAVAVAALSLIAVVAVAVIVTRPLGVAAPPGPTATVSASVLHDLRPATWRIDPSAEIGPESTSVPVLLTERECASAQSPEGRVAEPLIEYTADSIVIVLRVQMIGGDCPSNPEFPMTVELSEPIGQRTLIDAGEDPPTERWAPRAPTGTEPTILCGRHDEDRCHRAVDLVAAEAPAAVAAASAIVVDDACAQYVLCDRFYPFMSVVVLVPADRTVEPLPFLVVGTDYWPEEVREWAGPLPEHVVELVESVRVEPTVPTGPPSPAADRDRARDRLTELTQLTCFEETEGAQQIDDSTHDRVVELAGGAGWANIDSVWVGEVRWALSAFGSWEVLEESDESALIVRWAGHYPQALHLRTFTRAGRPPITVKDYELRVCGDPTWQTPSDPPSGTPPAFERPPDAPHPDGLRTDLADCSELDVVRTSDDSGMSFEYKVMSFTYFDSDGDEQYAEVRFTDIACQEHLVIGWLIGHLIETVSETEAPLPTQRPDSE